ncbi:MAG: hypothetical protein J6J72_04295 [Tyzzerella sp.]|nr:hypothetical protein [Tyzzerella sp.]
MMNLTFGEQVKIILSRKGMTIKQLAEEVEKHTGKPMSRQNMTQRLGRDNFQEQDMRMIAEILGCKFTLSISESEVTPMGDVMSDARDITVGELADIADDVTEVQVEPIEEITKEALPVPDVTETEEKQILRQGIKGYFRKGSLEPGTVAKEEQQVVGEINPYTRKEYESNSVRMHPKKIGYVQVYDREQHKWTDMTEWAFLGYQERKKQLLGKDYKPPIYLD